MRAKEFLREYNIDIEKGKGATPRNAEVDYFGFRVKMTPSVFLKLASPLQDGQSVEFFRQCIRDRTPVGPPTLTIEVPNEWRDGDFTSPTRVYVESHEGRNRMTAMKLEKGEVPVETHIFLTSPNKEWRTRFITPDIKEFLNNGMLNENKVAFVEGPLYAAI